MDQAALVELQVEEGAALARALKDQGFSVVAASWIKADDEEQWYLYLVSPNVDQDGLKQAYREMHRIMRSAPQLLVDPFEIRLVGEADAVNHAIRETHQRFKAPLATKLGQGRFAGKSIDGAFVYPPF